MAKNDTAWIILGVVTVGGLVFFLSRRPAAPVAVPFYNGLPPVMPPTGLPGIPRPLPEITVGYAGAPGGGYIPIRARVPPEEAPAYYARWRAERDRRLVAPQRYPGFGFHNSPRYLPNSPQIGVAPVPPVKGLPGFPSHYEPPHRRRRWTEIRENLPPGWRDLGRYQPGDFERGIARPPAIISPYYIRV